MLLYEGGGREDRESIGILTIQKRVQLPVLSPTGLWLVGKEYAHILV